MEIGTVRLVTIENEMRGSYIDYAMSVIMSRALPDVRDGLKPVQRRIIYAMDEIGLRSDVAYRKSATVVGEVLGKYHPHGDGPVYDTMVRLAQDFSMRYPLIDGQGNFGSIDNDPAAAMRYTEARMAAITNELLADIDKNTVDMVENFDGRHLQPVVLPARFPNLLVNGTTGIAVGMATNIPPHNLSEICDAVIHLVENREATSEDLMKFVKGPDFPTRGILIGAQGIRDAYTTGHGRVIIRAKAHIEESRNGRFQVVVTEIPYQVNKSAVIARIAELVKDKRLENISELRDESDRQGIRIIVEVGRGGNPRALLNNLYKQTQLQTSFSINMLALVDNQPRVLNLKSVLQHYIEHRIEVINRRTQFDLDKARARAHILEGLKIAIDNLDAVIRTIRESASADVARGALMARFALSEVQAQAILDMQLRRLAALETQKILDELAEVMKQIAYFEDLLANPEKVLVLIKDDLTEVRNKFGDARRTVISHEENGDFSAEDLIPQQQVVVTISQRGYIKRVPADTYRVQGRGGRGKTGMVTREADAVQHILVANTHDSVLFFTNRGKVFHLKAHEIPELSRTGKGVPLINIANVDPDEMATAMIVVKDFQAAENLLFVTRKGEVKRVRLSDFANVRPSGLIAMDIEKGDELAWVRMTEEAHDAILIAAGGKAARFGMQDVRLSNRGSGGMRGMKLIGDDILVGAEIVDATSGDLLMVTDNGFGKRTKLSLFPSKGRGTQGVIALGISSKTRKLAATTVVYPDDELIILSEGGIVIRMSVNQVNQLGRAAQGVTMMKIGDSDRVVSAARVEKEEQETPPAEGKNGAGPKGTPPNGTAPSGLPPRPTK